ncbi:unnamed protein product [Rangifer tarandus platyrhynchus]|uniref:Uncharacterized protein n=1 Tax=Rangifer tarandus platyrhynchus TaxID=3082113 RepID=A0ABN8ZJX6_RANTA|nr:unnamed protein product [Rangifer tarandus platyrhynchus]
MSESCHNEYNGAGADPSWCRRAGSSSPTGWQLFSAPRLSAPWAEGMGLSGRISKGVALSELSQIILTRRPPEDRLGPGLPFLEDARGEAETPPGTEASLQPQRGPLGSGDTAAEVRPDVPVVSVALRAAGRTVSTRSVEPGPLQSEAPNALLRESSGPGSWPGPLLASRPCLHMGLCLTGQRLGGVSGVVATGTQPLTATAASPPAGRSTGREQGQGPKQGARRAVQEPLLAGPS